MSLLDMIEEAEANADNGGNKHWEHISPTQGPWVVSEDPYCTAALRADWAYGPDAGEDTDTGEGVICDLYEEGDSDYVSLAPVVLIACKRALRCFLGEYRMTADTDQLEWYCDVSPASPRPWEDGPDHCDYPAIADADGNLVCRFHSAARDGANHRLILNIEKLQDALRLACKEFRNQKGWDGRNTKRNATVEAALREAIDAAVDPEAE